MTIPSLGQASSVADSSGVAPDASWKSLRLRRPDRCAACGRDLAAGEQARWYRARRLVTCPGCDLVTEKPEESPPGASAGREYERRHRKREAHARRKLGRFGLVLARVFGEPASTTAWKTGADGEVRVGRRLEELLAGAGVKLLHDRRMPGLTSANIDHIAIGPGGITVIDTKNYRGKVRVKRIGGLFFGRRGVLMIGGHDRTTLIDGLERQIAAVHSVVASIGHELIDVRGALCFANPDGLPLLRQQRIRDVLIDGTRSAAKLARRPGSLGGDQIERLSRRLADALPPA